MDRVEVTFVSMIKVWANYALVLAFDIIVSVATVICLDGA